MTIMDANRIEQRVADVILDRMIPVPIGEGVINIRALRFGTLMELCRAVCEAGLTKEKIEAGKSDMLHFFMEYAELMLRCVAIAELNTRDLLTEEKIQERMNFYRDNLIASQICTLFEAIVDVSAIEGFTNTIRVILKMKKETLSPEDQGG
jgi:hypothetical protein